jgi:hypothetical protein
MITALTEFPIGWVCVVPVFGVVYNTVFPPVFHGTILVSTDRACRGTGAFSSAVSHSRAWAPAM